MSETQTQSEAQEPKRGPGRPPKVRDEMRVRVMPGKIGIYNERRYRGAVDDNDRQQGDVFTIRPREITVVEPMTHRPIMENGRPKMRLLTCEEQFSDIWMEEVSMTIPETARTSQQALDEAQGDITKMRRGE